MNFKMVQRLILKDWYLHRWALLGAALGGVASLAIVAYGGKTGFFIGLLGLITVLIAFGAQFAVSTMVYERKEQTLPFVMSLPISYREYTASKMLANLIIFLAVWVPLVVCSFAMLWVSPNKILGLVPFTAIMAVEILAGICLVAAVALTTESQGWTIAAILVGNLAINIIGYLVAHVESIAKGLNGPTVSWTPAASVLLFAELATIALILGGTFFVQSRKRDFL